jgi:peptidoglycan hydrolase-like protein with peptidoglycan-binding domain
VIRTINLFTKAVLDTPTSWLDKFSSVWLVGDYYYSSIDGVGDDGTRRVIREYKRAHGLPEDGKIG